jgi:hypothetical protein
MIGMGNGNRATNQPGRGLRPARCLTLLTAIMGMMWLPCFAAVQSTVLKTIEFYGLQKVPEASVRQALQISEGEKLPNSGEAADAMEKRLRALPGVEDAKLNAVCCVSGKTVLFVGIEEKGAHPLRFRAAPKGKVRLSDRVVQAGVDFDKALQEAVQQGDAGEDDSQGYALMNNAAARAVQQRFLIFASLDSSPYQDVLVHSSDETHRALAALILGYANPKDQSVVNDLVTGMSDPDATVRNNAMRSLAVRAIAEQNRPQSEIKIPYEPFVRLLNSLDWTDRNKACFALLQLSEKHDPAFFKSLRKEALPALKEMAHWTKSGYGQPAFIILGRMNGLSDAAILKAWQEEDYATVTGADGGGSKALQGAPK